MNSTPLRTLSSIQAAEPETLTHDELLYRLADAEEQRDHLDESLQVLAESMADFRRGLLSYEDLVISADDLIRRVP